MTFIDNILKKRNISEPTPFWKLHIYEEEMSELVDYIKTALSSAHFGYLSLSERKRLYKEFDREACLLYALWWSRKYDGGKQSWEEPLLDFGIDLSYLDYVKEAILNELKNTRRLNITIFRSEANFHMYLQSLLAQGGLPMQLMTSEYSSSFENYLYFLISEYEDMDMRDWTNITTAKSLAEKYLNNRTLKESEAVLDFSMEIVKAYISNDDSAFSNYDQIKNIISHIREKRGNRPKQDRKYFRVTWEVKLSNNSFDLYYSISVPREIYLDSAHRKDSEGNDINVVSYYIANRLVGSFHKQGEKYLLMPGTSSNQKHKWDEKQGHLVLMKKIKNDLLEEHSLINSQPPYLDEPLLLQYKNGTWVPKQLQNNETYACLMPKHWHCNELHADSEVEYDGKLFIWSNIDWDAVPSGVLHFVNTNTDEELTLDRTISEYSVSMIYDLPQWIEYTSESLLVNVDDVRSYFRFFKEEEPCQKHGFKFQYKVQNSAEYQDYSFGILPSGPIVLKVRYPDGLQSKTFSFYNISGLDVERIGKDMLRVKYSKGTFALLANQNIEKPQKDIYKVLDSDNLRGLAPMRFRIYPTGVSTPIEIGFTTPIQKSCFIDSEGNILERNYPVALCELHHYKINLSEHTRIVISYYEQTDNLSTCVTRKEFFLGKGRYPLDIVKDEIERFVLINGFNDYRKYLSIKLAGTDSELRIRRNAFRAQQCTNEEGSKGVFVKRNNEPASALQLHAIAINATEESPLYHSDEILLVEGEEPGHYYLPELEDNSITEFVVFSDNTLGTGNMLPFFLNTGMEMDKDSRDANKRNSIANIQLSLLSGNEIEWKNTWFYVDLVIKYRLSYYNSFNTFFAIVDSCDLLSEFLVRIKNSGLLSNYDNSTIVDELQRMERELSFRFHYLPTTCWQKQQDRLGKDYDNLIEQMPAIKNAIGEKMDYIDKCMSLLQDLLKCQFGEENDFLMPIYYTLLGNVWPVKPEFSQQERDYLMQVCDALSDFDKFYTPNDLKIIRVEYHKQRPWNRYRADEVIQKLQYLAIVLPQCAAQYVHGADIHLWDYQVDSNANEFIRRMINYISIYASEAYNELFKIALLRQPVIQPDK